MEVDVRPTCCTLPPPSHVKAFVMTFAPALLVIDLDVLQGLVGRLLRSQCKLVTIGLLLPEPAS